MKIVRLLAVILGLVFAWGCQSKPHHPVAVTQYVVTHPIQKDTLIYQEYVSQIRSIQHIELRALERGYLQKILVDEGQFVKKGTLLFQILPLVYQAEVAKAQAETDFAAIEYQNTLQLATDNIVSASEVALAKARLNKATAELQLATTHLGFTNIRAPFDGMVGRFNDLRGGSLLEEGELLTTLSDNHQMWVYFNVPEAVYLDYTYQKASHQWPLVKLKLANKQLYEQDGKIETLEADFNNETGNIAFRATFNNAQGILRHGETGNIWLPRNFSKALLIPQKATFEILDKRYVFVVDAKGTVETRAIEIAEELPHLFIVAKGLQVDDQILIEGIRKVKNKQVITFSQQAPEAVLAQLHGLHAE